MKKIALSLAVLLSLAFILSACSAAPAKKTESTKAADALRTEPTKETTAAPKVKSKVALDLIYAKDGKTVHEEISGSFEDWLKTREGLVLVDFWAEWCGPCVASGPIVEKIAVDYTGKKLDVVKVNVDYCDQKLPAKYGVSGIPRFIVMNNKGEAIGSVTGAIPNLDESLRKIIDTESGKK